MKQMRLLLLLGLVLLVGNESLDFLFGEARELGSFSQHMNERKTVWDGIYTESQSMAGGVVYEQQCSSCHGEAASGQSGPKLNGSEFFEDWREDNVSSLYGYIRSSMPRRRPPLSDPDYLAVTTYLLRENGFPAGDEPLTFKSMRTVRIEGKEGPQPLPPNSLVQVTGCLTPSGGDWMLSGASEPIRNRNPNSDSPLTDDELRFAQEQPTGNLGFNLTNFFMLGDFDPASHRGHKMVARGALIRRSNADRISLTDIDMVSVACGQ